MLKTFLKILFDKDYRRNHKIAEKHQILATKAKHQFGENILKYLKKQQHKYVTIDDFEAIEKYSGQASQNHYYDSLGDLKYYTYPNHLIQSINQLKLSIHHSIHTINKIANYRNHVYYYDVYKYDSNHKRFIPHYLSPKEDNRIKYLKDSSTILVSKYPHLMLISSDWDNNNLNKVQPLNRVKFIKYIKKDYHLR